MRYAMTTPHSVMPRLDLGISRRKVTIPAPESPRRVDFTSEMTPGDAKIKSWHDGIGGEYF
jgi:hypothetical protein